MGKKAFVIGFNYKLAYAENDAKKMKNCLKNYGYEIYPPTNKNKSDITEGYILDEFNNMLTECSKDDSVIFYFAGHGSPHGGDFKLIINETNNVIIKNIVSRLKECNKVKNYNKLIILDCCHAGTITREKDLDFNYPCCSVLMATLNGETVSDLGGGFLTEQICLELTYPDEICDNGKIRINKLCERLKDAAQFYNDNNKKKPIPIPKLWHGDQLNFEIATCPDVAETITPSKSNDNAQDKKPQVSPVKNKKKQENSQKQEKNCASVLPYLSNRQLQKSELEKAIKAYKEQYHDNKQRPLLCLIHGSASAWAN
jgi:hypothetical protein